MHFQTNLVCPWLSLQCLPRSFKNTFLQAEQRLKWNGIVCYAAGGRTTGIQPVFLLSQRCSWSCRFALGHQNTTPELPVLWSCAHSGFPVLGALSCCRGNQGLPEKPPCRALGPISCTVLSSVKNSAYISNTKTKLFKGFQLHYVLKVLQLLEKVVLCIKSQHDCEVLQPSAHVSQVP